MQKRAQKWETETQGQQTLMQRLLARLPAILPLRLLLLLMVLLLLTKEPSVVTTMRLLPGLPQMTPLQTTKMQHFASLPVG